MVDVTTNEILMSDGSAVSYDGLTQTAFNLIFPKAPHITMFLQGFELPGINVSQVIVPTPYVDMNDIGEKIQYTPFNCTFLIDSEFKNYKEMYDWMKRMSAGGTKIGDVDEVVLVINGKQSIRFTGAWPTSLSSVSFITNATDVEYLTATVSMNFDYYYFLD